jgi:hypothetical protein
MLKNIGLDDEHANLRVNWEAAMSSYKRVWQKEEDKLLKTVIDQLLPWSNKTGEGSGEYWQAVAHLFNRKNGNTGRLITHKAARTRYERLTNRDRKKQPASNDEMQMLITILDRITLICEEFGVKISDQTLVTKR